MINKSELEQLFEKYQSTFSDFVETEVTDVNQRGMGEDQLLHLAASHSNIKEVRLLVENGADVNGKGDIGLTPLHLAASKGKADIVDYLLSKGANRHQLNDFDESAHDWAKNNGFKNIAALLK